MDAVHARPLGRGAGRDRRGCCRGTGRVPARCPRQAVTSCMRILHVIPTVGPSYGGPSVAARAMTRALAARGHDVTLATTDAASDSGNRLDVPVSRPVVDGGVIIR